MPNIQPSTLREIGYQLFEASGCTAEDAGAVVDHLVESNLFGHDSHGAIRYYEYTRAIREGTLSTACGTDHSSRLPQHRGRGRRRRTRPGWRNFRHESGD